MKIGRILQSLFPTVFVLISAFSISAKADSQFELYKAYAGIRDSTSLSFFTVEAKAHNNERQGLTVPDTTVVECKKSTWIGVAFYIRPERTNYVSFEQTWYHPHLQLKDAAREHTYSIMYRRAPGQKLELQWLGWELRNKELIDGDIVLVLHKDKRVLLRHEFQIRGCDLTK